ncbi:MAG TPA: hypothetical protein VFT91_05830 [Dehalococcoidia bacterium]|nr:hypothetical protein [Dehalococcoidia bacterium]
MVACVHVAKILPGQKEEFLRQLKESFEAGKDGLRAFGFQRIVSFFSPEVVGGDNADGLLVTVYEADDPSVVERFYQMEAVLQQEARAHGVLVAPHDHEAVPRNVAYLDLDLTA